MTETKIEIENTSEKFLNNLSYTNHLSSDLLNEPTKETRSVEIKNIYIVGLVISIVLHILDVGTDVYLAFQYYQYKENSYFVLTVCFIIFPAFINTMISTRMYAVDTEPVSWQKWVLRSLVLTFLFAPIIRYVETLQYAIKFRSSKQNHSIKYEKYYKPLLREDSNLSLLRIIECFLEAAPQQVLQIAILLHLEDRDKNYLLLEIYQYMTISTSLVSIAWSFAIYNRSIRFARDDKQKMSWTGSLLQFSWLFLVTSSRILAISEAASVFPKSTFVACIVHWFIMTLWLSIFEQTHFCHSSTSNSNATEKLKKSLEISFCAVLGLVYIFAFVTTSDGHTRYKYIFYYSVCFVENTIAILLWSVWGKPESVKCWWFIPLLVITFVMFLLGIVLMLVYYSFYHPQIGINRKSKYSTSHIHKLQTDEEWDDVSSQGVQTSVCLMNLKD